MPSTSVTKTYSATVKITEEGIRDHARNCCYYAEWMKDHQGKAVHVYSDLFSSENVVVFDAETNELLGNARTVVRLRGRMFKNNNRLFVNLKEHSNA